MSKHKKTSQGGKASFTKAGASNDGFIGKAKAFYLKEYKKLFFVVIFLTIFSVFSIYLTYRETGDFTRRDVSLKGGISLNINLPYQDLPGLEAYLSGKFPAASFNIRTIESAGAVKGIIIEASDISEQDLMVSVNERIPGIGKDDYSVETMGSSLGQSFFKEMFVALSLAFLSMALVFHFYFRNLYGTFAAMLSAFLDIFITLGVMNLLGIRLTAGGIAAYLMLIGYSVDTSILLSTKLLKEKNDDQDKALFSAMKTGLTMSISGIAAVGVSFIFTNNEVLKQIMLILIVGLMVDIITTWIGNVAFLKVYLEKRSASNNSAVPKG